jgi:polysaccharide biosynthesis protein PslG
MDPALLALQRDATARFATTLALGLVLLGCGPIRPPAVTKPISFAVLEDYDKDADLADVARDFRLLRELGVPAWRGSFGWDDYEPERGRFDFEWLRRFATLADSMGISLRPYIGYTPAWAARGGSDDRAWNDPPRALEEWSRFAEAVARALARHPSIRSYEIYNEENVRLWWDGTAEDYAAVLRAGATAVRRGDADATVLLGGMVWPDAEWVEHACRGGAPFDVLPFHAYPETWTADSITIENYLGTGFKNDFLPEADSQCGRQPIWINETGFATTPGKSERDQAEWWARAFATFLAAPRIEHLGIYELRDQRLDTPVIGDAPNYYLGLVRRDGTPKAAFATVRLLVRLFRGDSVTVADGDLDVRVTAGSTSALHHHLFLLPDGRRLAFVWDRGASPTVELRLRTPPGSVKLWALEGTGEPWTAVSGRVLRDVHLERGGVRIFEISPPPSR